MFRNQGTDSRNRAPHYAQTSSRYVKVQSTYPADLRVIPQRPSSSTAVATSSELDQKLTRSSSPFVEDIRQTLRPRPFQTTSRSAIGGLLVKLSSSGSPYQLAALPCDKPASATGLQRLAST